MKNKFILFEGPDGAGKTTLAKKVGEFFGINLYPSPPEEFREARESIRNASPEESLNFYLWINIHSSGQIQKKLKSSMVVADRYVFSTIVYHSLLLNRDVDIPEGILMPDKIFLITASRNVLKQRYAERRDKKVHEKIDFQMQMLDKYREILNKYSAIEIDTSKDTPEQSFEMIMRGIQ